jgi:hypothetical protein
MHGIALIFFTDSESIRDYVQERLLPRNSLTLKELQYLRKLQRGDTIEVQKNELSGVVLVNDKWNLTLTIMPQNINVAYEALHGIIVYENTGGDDNDVLKTLQTDAAESYSTGHCF